jgi:hypothetical protein
VNLAAPTRRRTGGPIDLSCASMPRTGEASVDGADPLDILERQ